MTWMCVMLTRYEIKLDKHIRLQDTFQQAFLEAGGPKAAAMFQNDPSDDEYGFYFTPGLKATLDPPIEDGPPRTISPIFEK